MHNFNTSCVYLSVMRGDYVMTQNHVLVVVVKKIRDLKGLTNFLSVYIISFFKICF